ncbi:MAG TPA: cation transporter [Trebonia sp.]|jgi:Co/Zn/Cd efflux system component|nr:cation transporter [Trebonia sp.]
MTPWQSAERFIHPHAVHNLPWVAVAGVAGFAGNELAARYRIRVGTRIGSAVLVADGHHARTDGFTSLAVVAGAGGVALGWPQANRRGLRSRPAPRRRRTPRSWFGVTRSRCCAYRNLTLVPRALFFT